MAERGRLYLWPRNRSFGDSKVRPVLVLAPDAATRHGRRWVVLPLSSESRLATNPLAYALEASAASGLQQTSFVMSWLPTTVHADQLQGPLGRVTATEFKAIAAMVIHALDLHCQEPWDGQPERDQS
jgi:mRNA-degrading endonuclease toxin of MazEF toxin-antitoxin module